MLACCCCVRCFNLLLLDCSIGVEAKFRCHNLVRCDRCPSRMMLFLKCTSTLVASNRTLHPESHSWPIEMRPCSRFGNRCASLAFLGSNGVSSSAAWVGWMKDTSDCLTGMLLVATCMFINGEFTKAGKK